NSECIQHRPSFAPAAGDGCGTLENHELSTPACIPRNSGGKTPSRGPINHLVTSSASAFIALCQSRAGDSRYRLKPGNQGLSLPAFIHRNSGGNGMTTRACFPTPALMCMFVLLTPTYSSTT